MRSHKHSSYSSSFPIYLFTQKEREVPDDDAESEAENKEEKSTESEEMSSDDDEAVVEDVSEDKESPAPVMRKIIVDEWEQLNAQPPLWTR